MKNTQTRFFKLLPYLIDSKVNAENDSIFQLAEQWFDEGRKLALATVLETWGSSPRPAGSRLLVDSNGNFQGSVSGGCVETAVITEAMAVMEDCKMRVLEYGVSNEMAWEVGLACGGRIKILVEPVMAG